MAGIDTRWFHQQLEARGDSVRGLARFMGLDPSAVSRMLKGERRMSAEEQDRICSFLGVALEEIAARRRGEPGGFGESTQAEYRAGDRPSAPEKPSTGIFTREDIVHKNGKRYREMEDGELLELHPIFGCMEGTITVMPGVDLTEPMDFEWSGKLYNE